MSKYLAQLPELRKRGRGARGVMAILITITSVVSGATSAKSQAVAELFSYKAPSGAPGDGIMKWELYRFIHEDAERVANLRAIDRPKTNDGLAVRNATYSLGRPTVVALATGGKLELGSSTHGTRAQKRHPSRSAVTKRTSRPTTAAY